MKEKHKTGIVSVIYTEPYWSDIQRRILECKVPTVFVNRGGVGSLAKAHNDGFDRLVKEFDVDYVWFITNVMFDPAILQDLESAMDKTNYDIIHPAFSSDHVFCRPDGSDEVKSVPFVEFTSPIVKASTFSKLRLDERMPYWGHDFDFGYRVRLHSGKVGVHHGVTIDHEYIRFSVNTKPHPHTRRRLSRRRSTDKSTKLVLRSLYGNNWRDKMFDIVR